MTGLETALERIEECRRTRSVELDLSKLELSEIPEQVFELRWLQKLDVSGSYNKKGKIEFIPSTINQLKELTQLDCKLNKISDLSPLSQLQQLMELYCDSNKISDLSPLSQLRRLFHLTCFGNQIRNLSPLSKLQQLTQLQCRFNEINDLSPLSHLPQLEQLECDNNKISNLLPLSQLQQLTLLCCDNNEISDLSPLSSLYQLRILDCSYNEISDLSPLSQLQKLTQLYCGGNQISDLSPLSELNKLSNLGCFSNKIDRLSPISKLKQLTHLVCYRNEIRDLSPLSQLLQLKHLECDNNEISDLSPLNQLQHLMQLCCDSNEISDLSPLANLQQLRHLECGYNLISSISTIYPLIINDNYSYLTLYGNPLNEIPEELLGEGQFDSCQNQLKNYFLDIEKKKILKQQIKVQLIGNGRVGKSTLAYALEYKKAPDQSFKETHGIVIKEIEFALDALDKPVTLQLWDFGGQEIYHATHRLFLSPDSLYLLLWAEETDEHDDEICHPVSYWLDAIHDLASDSPVILIKNQIDRADQLPIEPVGLDSDIPGFAQIKQTVKISAMNYKGMAVLRGAIEEVLGELKNKLQILLPTSWIDIAHELEKRREKKSIPFVHFQQLCILASVSDAKVLAEYLHNTGAIFYKPDTFQDQIVLDQNWAIDAVYYLFDPNGKRDLVERMGGHFYGKDAEFFWPKVDKTEHEIYLDFMRNCGICYEPDPKRDKAFGKREFIIPALLPESTDAKLAWGKRHADDWLFEIEYPFLHRSIIERLIIELGKKYQGSPWRYGTFCTTDRAQLLLECKRQESKGQLRFKLRGDNLSDLLHDIRVVVKEISPHKFYVEYLTNNDNARTRLLSNEIGFFNRVFKALFADESKNNGKIRVLKEVKLFISYSHADEKPYKDELELCLKSIQRKFSQLTYWDDRQIFAGELVDTQIFERLEPADIVVLLISRNFFASEYCFSIEMEKALEQFERGNNIVIPIIIRETADWHDFEIGRLTALPTDGKPLSQWDDEDAFWADVQKGIRRQVEKRLESL